MQIEQTQKSGDVIDAAVQDANRGGLASRSAHQTLSARRTSPAPNV